MVLPHSAKCIKHLYKKSSKAMLRETFLQSWFCLSYTKFLYMVISASAWISRILLHCNQQQFPLSTKGKSHIRLYMHWSRSCAVTCVCPEPNVRSSRIVLPALIYMYGLLAKLQNAVLAEAVPLMCLGYKIAEYCHNLIRMLLKHMPAICKHPW